MGCIHGKDVKIDGSAVLSEINLVPNPTFDLHMEGEHSPLGWTELYRGGEAKARWEDTPGIPHSGAHCLKIESESGGDGEWYADVRVEPNTEYKLSGEIKGKDIKGGGAFFAVSNIKGVKTEAVTGTVTDWKRHTVSFNSGENIVIRISAVFGGGSNASGQAWYDTIDLTRPKGGVDKEPNLFPNPACSLGMDGRPFGWVPRHVSGPAAEAIWASGPGVPRVGTHCLSLKAAEETHSTWYCDIRVEPNTDYHFSTWIKSAGLKGGSGAYFIIPNVGSDVKTVPITTDGDYREVTVDFNSKKVQCVRVVAVLGPGTSGQAWYDDMTLLKKTK